MSIKFLVLGGGNFGLGGGSADFIFMGAGTFLTLPTPPPKPSWAHSEGRPQTEGTVTGTLVKVGDLRRNSSECQGGLRELYGTVGSPKFA